MGKKESGKTEKIPDAEKRHSIAFYIFQDCLRNPPYILNAMDAATNLVIAQIPIPEKSPATYQEIQNIFEGLEKEKAADPETFAKENKERYSEYSSYEKNRERVEHREVKCYTNQIRKPS